MSEEPTYTEVRDLLDQLLCVMVAHKFTKVPEYFDFVWPDKLYALATALDNCNRLVYVLRQTSDESFTWCEV